MCADHCTMKESLLKSPEMHNKYSPSSIASPHLAEMQKIMILSLKNWQEALFSFVVADDGGVYLYVIILVHTEKSSLCAFKYTLTHLPVACYMWWWQTKQIIPRCAASMTPHKRLKSSGRGTYRGSKNLGKIATDVLNFAQHKNGRQHKLTRYLQDFCRLLEQENPALAVGQGWCCLKL